jgi:hypothetical protein
MRWGPPAKTENDTWYRTFALLPVQTITGHWAWLEYVGIMYVSLNFNGRVRIDYKLLDGE